MKDICVQMLVDSLKAFLNRDLDLARKSIDEDDKIDDLNDQIFRELLTYMPEDPRNIKRANALSNKSTL